MLPAICSSSTVPFVAIPVHLAMHPVTSKCGDRGTERSGDARCTFDREVPITEPLHN